MRYYQITNDTERVGRWHLGIPRNKANEDIDVWSLLDGRSLALGRWTVPIEEVGEKLGITWGPFGLLYATSQAAEIIETVAASNVQLIQAELSDRSPIHIVNILTHVDFIDQARSGLLRYPENHPRLELRGKPYFALRLCARPGTLSSQHIARPVGLRQEVVISEKLLGAFRDEGITGFLVFSEIAD